MIILSMFIFLDPQPVRFLLSVRDCHVALLSLSFYIKETNYILCIVLFSSHALLFWFWFCSAQSHIAYVCILNTHRCCPMHTQHSLVVGVLQKKQQHFKQNQTGAHAHSLTHSHTNKAYTVSRSSAMPHTVIFYDFQRIKLDMQMCCLFIYLRFHVCQWMAFEITNEWTRHAISNEFWWWIRWNCQSVKSHAKDAHAANCIRFNNQIERMRNLAFALLR